MPIRRTQPRAEPAALPEPVVSEPVATKTIRVRDIELNFGKDDGVTFTLVPEDTFEIRPTTYYVHLMDANEEIEIERSLVRWRSIRARDVTVPVSFDPATLDPANQ